MSYGGFGGALVLIAVGAILRYAVTWEAENVDVGTVGVILMLAGGVLFLVTLFFFASAQRRPGGPPPPPGY